MAFFNLLHKSKDNFQSKNIKPILKEYNQMHLLRTLKKNRIKEYNAGTVHWLPAGISGQKSAFMQRIIEMVFF